MAGNLKPIVERQRPSTFRGKPYLYKLRWSKLRILLSYSQETSCKGLTNPGFQKQATLFMSLGEFTHDTWDTHIFKRTHAKQNYPVYSWWGISLLPPLPLYTQQRCWSQMQLFTWIGLTGGGGGALRFFGVPLLSELNLETWSCWKFCRPEKGGLLVC